MNRDKIYDDLIKQYNSLTDDEKRAVVIYKSKLYKIINLITSIDGFEFLSVNEIVERLPNLNGLRVMVSQFKEILNRPENMIVRFCCFNNINFDDFNLLIEYLRDVYFILNSTKDKIILNEDLIVYRGIAVDDFSEAKDMAMGNIISTSIDIEDTEPYMSFRDKALLYIIKIKKGTPLLVAPNSLYCIYEDREDYLYKKLNGVPATKLTLNNGGVEKVKQVILFKDGIEFIEEKSEIREIDGKFIAIHQVDCIPKYKEFNRTKK